MAKGFRQDPVPAGAWLLGEQEEDRCHRCVQVSLSVEVKAVLVPHAHWPFPFNDILSLSPSRYVTLGMLLNFSEPVSSSGRWRHVLISSAQFSSVTQSCPTLCDPMNRSTPGLPVHHHLPEFTQTYLHRVSDPIQPAHPLSSPFPPAPNPSQHESFPMIQLFA